MGRSSARISRLQALSLLHARRVDLPRPTPTRCVASKDMALQGSPVRHPVASVPEASSPQTDFAKRARLRAVQEIADAGKRKGLDPAALTRHLDELPNLLGLETFLPSLDKMKAADW